MNSKRLIGGFEDCNLLHQSSPEYVYRAGIRYAMELVVFSQYLETASIYSIGFDLLVEIYVYEASSQLGHIRFQVGFEVCRMMVDQ